MLQNFQHAIKCAATLIICTLPLFESSCSGNEDDAIWTAEDGNILKEGHSEYFIGANLFDAAGMAVNKTGRIRLGKELDTLETLGVTRLRFSAAEGGNMAGLLYTLDCLRQRGMSAVLILNNACERKQHGKGYVRAVVSQLKEHPAIFSWEISDEEPCPEDSPRMRDEFISGIHNTAAVIKSVDHKHLVSVGEVGTKDFEEDMDLYERINGCEDIDYLTVHLPCSCSLSADEETDEGIVKAGRYMDERLDLARRLNKPLIIEDSGSPEMYRYVSGRVIKSAENGGNLAGYFFSRSEGLEQQRFENMTRLRYELSSGCLFCGDDDRNLHVEVTNPGGGDVEIGMALVSDLSLMSESRDTVLFITENVKGEYAETDFSLDGVGSGFYQVNLSWKKDGRAGHYDSFNIGIDPENIDSPQDKRPGFDEFWNTTLSELATTPMAIKKEYSPEHSDSLRNSYRVEITSFRGGKMGGILCEPVKEGKYPVYIDYMGYGAEPFWYDPSAAPEAIEFLVSVRDQGIFKDSGERWIDRGLESKYKFYYRGAFCDVVRAVDFVASLEKADTSHIFARGESQGGAFTLISAALDHRISAAAPAVPFLGDYRHYSQIVWWPMWEVFEEADRQGISRERLFTMLSYFDVKNFMDRIECPVYMAFGLQDSTCPPHTNFAEYNLIKSPKKYFCVPNCGHAIWKEKTWREEREKWFETKLK